MVKQWDVHHFIEIAEVGYPNVDPNLIAFFPGLPVSMWLLGKLGISATVAGLLIANISALFAALALGRLSGRWAALAWLVAPAGVFAFVGYTEGPFTAAFFWAWERARRGKWGAAAAFASLASVFRVSGIFVIAALVVIALLEAKNWAERRRALAWLTVPVLAAGVYHLYVWWLTSDPMGWSHAQAAGWPRSFHWPWEALNTTWGSTSVEASPFFYLLFRYEFAAALFTAPFLVYLLMRKRWPELVFITLNFAAFSFSDFYLSYARSMLYWLPLWLLIGELLGDKAQAGGQLELQVKPRVQWLRWVRLVAAVVYLGVSAWAMDFWANIFFTGQWAG
ncbi:MAG: hypothetical protein Q3999_01820 [Buchananella hordeovulneris]|nr:hypothetical protein [Buchananella hordeovulneris]